jgi:hypothetical protein
MLCSERHRRGSRDDHLFTSANLEIIVTIEIVRIRKDDQLTTYRMGGRDWDAD